MTGYVDSARGMAALRRLAARKPKLEVCDLCAAVVREEHQHLIDAESRRVVCACDACAILFDRPGATKYRRVPRDIRALRGFDIDDALWNSFGIPIGLVFFFRSSVSKRAFAVYPSPGGPAEAEIDENDWSELAGRDPRIQALVDDVEALLVNRTKGTRHYFIVPIDECYRLSGIVRRYWTGFSGGDELWQEIGGFFEYLRQRAAPAGSAYA